MANNDSGSARSYEVVAQELLLRFKEEFGLVNVEGTQKIPGKESGTEWAIDAKGIQEGGDAFVIVECRRYAKSKLKQEALAAIAYRIQDTGAVGGITVSPFDLQRGAKMVADANNIVHVQLNPQSTSEEFRMEFLNKLFFGMHESLAVADRLSITLKYSDGRSETKEF